MFDTGHDYFGEYIRIPLPRGGVVLRNLKEKARECSFKLMFDPVAVIVRAFGVEITVFSKVYWEK